MTHAEIIEKYEDSYNSEEKLKAFKFLMTKRPTDLEIRFQFIDDANEFDFFKESMDTLKNFFFSSDPKTQKQSLAYVYATYYPEDSIQFKPLENGSRTNYIRGIRAYNNRDWQEAKDFFWTNYKSIMAIPMQRIKSYGLPIHIWAAAICIS